MFAHFGSGLIIFATAPFKSGRFKSYKVVSIIAAFRLYIIRVFVLEAVNNAGEGQDSTLAFSSILLVLFN
jgi:hypothetical protein